MRSFSDGDTHFRVVKSGTPPSVDGLAIHEPTGEIECLECGRRHEVVEEIPHHPNCDQRGVTSRFWEEQFASD